MSFSPTTTTVYKVKVEGGAQALAETKQVASGFDQIKRSAVQANAVVATASKESDVLWASMLAKGKASAVAADAVAARAASSGLGTGAQAGLLGGLAGKATLGAAAGAGFVVFQQLRGGLKLAQEAEQTQVQIAQAIKQTGGVANVTAKDVENLSQKYAWLAGKSTASVRSAESILLTFPKIRNEFGKGNDVFNRASLSVENLAVRLRTDAPSAALQLGKALEEPVSGVSALRSQGILFTNQQVDQIKVMAAAGDRLGEQKVLLAQLNSQVGGAAAAAGKTNEASWQRMMNSWDNAKRQLVTQILPTLTTLNNWLAVKIPVAASAASKAWSTATSKNNTGPFGSVLNFMNSPPEGPKVLKWMQDNPHPWAVAGDLVGIGDGPGKARTQARDAQGAAERLRQQRAVTRDLALSAGQDSWTTPTQKWNIDLGEALRGIPIILTVDGKVLAQANTKNQQRQAASSGRGGHAR